MEIEYNFEYLVDLAKSDEHNHELSKIINTVDKNVTNSSKDSVLLFHIVPILYTITIISGFTILLYKIIM